MSPEKPTASLPPSIKWYENSNCFLIFKGSYLKQKKVQLYCSKYNKFICCLWIRHMVTKFKFWFYFKFFGGVKLAKNAYPDKYVYSIYSIGFNSLSLPGCSVGENERRKGYLYSWWRSNSRIRWYYISRRSSIFK